MEEKKRRSNESSDEIEDFKGHFPSLFKELSEGRKEIQEEEIRTSHGSKRVRRFKGYIPSVVDFICRCKNEEEAIEIIEYMFNKGDISEEYSETLKKQLKEKGLEFFGEHRAPGFYERA